MKNESKNLPSNPSLQKEPVLFRCLTQTFLPLYRQNDGSVAGPTNHFIRLSPPTFNSPLNSFSLVRATHTRACTHAHTHTHAHTVVRKAGDASLHIVSLQPSAQCEPGRGKTVSAGLGSEPALAESGAFVCGCSRGRMLQGMSASRELAVLSWIPCFCGSFVHTPKRKGKGAIVP